MGTVEDSAPHWMPVGNAKDAPTNGSGELTLPAAEPQWAPEPVEPRDAIVVDDIEAQLLATDVERATERQDYRERTMASPSLDVAPPMQTPLPDPPAPPTMPDDPPVKVIATSTASTTDRAVIGHAEGNGNGTSNGQRHRQRKRPRQRSRQRRAQRNEQRQRSQQRRANGSERRESDTDEHLVGFAHFPDATAAPKIRWR